MSRPQDAARFGWTDLLTSANTWTQTQTFSQSWSLIASGAGGGLKRTTDTFYTAIAGGTDVVAANGAFVACYGNSHPTTPGRLNIVPGTSGELQLYNSGTAVAMKIAAAGVDFPLQPTFTNSGSAFICNQQTAQTCQLAPNTFIAEYNTSGISYLSAGGAGSAGYVHLYIRTKSGGSANNAIVAVHDCSTLGLNASKSYTYAGEQQMKFHVRVSSAGAKVSGSSSVSVSKVSTGRYRITHNLGDTYVSATANPETLSAGYWCTIGHISANAFDVMVWNSTSTNVDNAISVDFHRP